MYKDVYNEEYNNLYYYLRGFPSFNGGIVIADSGGKKYILLQKVITHEIRAGIQFKQSDCIYLDANTGELLGNLLLPEPIGIVVDFTSPR